MSSWLWLYTPRATPTALFLSEVPHGTHVKLAQRPVTSPKWHSARLSSCSLKFSVQAPVSQYGPQQREFCSAGAHTCSVSSCTALSGQNVGRGGHLLQTALGGDMNMPPHVPPSRSNNTSTTKTNIHLLRRYFERISSSSSACSSHLLRYFFFTWRYFFFTWRYFERSALSSS